jgi:hypothetical protein
MTTGEMTLGEIAAAPASRLVILLNGAPPDAESAVLLALRYASTAAAMDVATEVHFVGPCVALLQMGAADGELLAQLRQVVELDGEIFVCPVALAEQDMTERDLIAEVSGVRGAPSLVAAGMAPGARFMVF